LSSKLYGDWKRAGIVLKNLATRIYPVAQARLYKDGEIILEKLKGHIENQDLNWTPLSNNTVKLKNGDDTILVQTGWLKENLSVRRLKSSSKGSTIFVGASPWKTHPSGVKFSDLMLWIEYGTENMPPRPLMRPTFEEVKAEIEKNWKNVIINVAGGI
jgi:HK97 gp10 family phage protein